MAKNDSNDGAIFRLDTVPPPAGEADAYNAPTRVGEIPEDIAAELRKVEAEEEAAESARRAKAEVSDGEPRDVVPDVPPVVIDDADLPRVYEEDDDHAATMVRLDAKPPPPTVDRTVPLPGSLVRSVVADVDARAQGAAGLAPEIVRSPLESTSTEAAPRGLSASARWALVALLCALALATLAYGVIR